MPTLLKLDVSPRGDKSISRALAKRFIAHWQKNNPDGVVVKRDLHANPVPYMDIDWIAGVYAPAESGANTGDDGNARAVVRTDRGITNMRYVADQYADVQFYNSGCFEIVDRLSREAPIYFSSRPRLARHVREQEGSIDCRSRDT